eukprot:CAMPEP_0197416860 /NCGR_PEP_ID=MMETSP1170-20131217/3063_1 /TAXON_ID=54406 /ORGANISM="Sarcinochrysis sp, Strain CCMP770" /LENGTH=58 /DNA_ID=CAMNT_0042943791 /DNA_START=12 /DNA_END=185 /DNA_ORIENTATION=-
MSTNGRKPSRERLMDLLVNDGLGDRLEALAHSSGRALSIDVTLAPESLDNVGGGGPGI